MCDNRLLVLAGGTAPRREGDDNNNDDDEDDDVNDVAVDDEGAEREASDGAVLVDAIEEDP